MKKLFENEKVRIQHNEELECIELIWLKQHDVDTYKKAFIDILGFVKQHKAVNFLSDIRKEGVVGPSTSAWVQTEIMPKAFALGLQKIAVVMDADVFKEFYIKNIEKAAGSNKMKYFGSYEKANEWLAESLVSA